MADYLGHHPDIFMAEAKDSHFFGSDLHFVTNITHPHDMFRVSEETYLSWFSGRQEKRLGEASVLYLYSGKTAIEIRDFNLHADIIIMLRNPVDMMYSLHGHFLTDLNEDIEDFGEALAAETDRKKGRRIPSTTFSVDGLFYKEIAHYTEQVKRYFDVFGREKVHVIIFDDFTNDSAGTYRKAIQFLDVSPDFQPDFEIINPAKRLRSTSLKRFIVDPPGMFRPVGEALSRIEWFRRMIKKGMDRFNISYDKRPPMDPEIRRALLADFAPEVERLSKLLGRDLTHWNREDDT